MRRVGRTLTLVLAVGVVLAVSAMPVLGQEDAENTDAAVVETGPPAVEIADETAAEPLPDWTYRYMIPTTLALAAVVVLLTSIRYFTNVVRKRYRTVEE